MIDFSIIIAHRGNPMGAWMTIQSCEVDFLNTDLTREYIVVSNGNEESADTHNHMASLKAKGLLKHYSHRDEPMSPPTARNFGATHADGTYLAFFDNHCIVLPTYFRRAKACFERYDMDSLHSAYHYDIWGLPSFHYKLKLKGTFWGEESQIPEHTLLPYKIAMGGHGGFVVKNSTFKEVGGYWDGFVGYGGEEPYFDLKLAMLDKTNYTDPGMRHIHYVGKRGYQRHFTQDFSRNMMMAAHIIGGEKWMYSTFSSLMKATKMRFTDARLYEVMQEAYYKSEGHAAWLASVRKRTLEEQLQVFRTSLVAC